MAISAWRLGYVGGLWLLWKKDEVDVFVLSSTEQEIHATIQVCNSDSTWIISSVYASPRFMERKILWSNLSEVAKVHNLSWLLLGDFNETLCGNDKLGGRQVNLNRAIEFKDCLDSCNFIDLGFSRPKFTWSNQRQITELILERLDRCFANPSWRVLFPEAVVTHLPMVFSNHCPVLLELFKPPPAGLEKPFRFHTMWLYHPQFPEIVQRAWNFETNLPIAIKNFTASAMQWNINEFGNIFGRKKRVLARINGTKKSLSNGPSQFLIQLEKELITEYNLIL